MTYKSTTVHRYLAEQREGRRLETSEHVHHVDRDKHNNNLSNLVVLSASSHVMLHRMHTAIDSKHNNKFKDKFSALRLINQMVEEGHSYQTIGDVLGLSRANISLIHRKVIWKKYHDMLSPVMSKGADLQCDDNNSQAVSVHLTYEELKALHKYATAARSVYAPLRRALQKIETVLS